MIKNVVFDLGGVVVGRTYQQNKGIHEAFKFLQGEDFPQYWKDFDRGVVTQPEVAQHLSERTGKTVLQCSDMIDTIRDMYDEFPATVELIKRLSDAGYALYVLSNMPYEFYDYMSKFDVFKYFDDVLISSQEKVMKPDPAFFNLLFERFGLVPSETLFIDDKRMNIDAANKLGLHTFHFTDSENNPAQLWEMLRK